MLLLVGMVLSLCIPLQARSHPAAAAPAAAATMAAPTSNVNPVTLSSAGAHTLATTMFDDPSMVNFADFAVSPGAGTPHGTWIGPERLRGFPTHGPSFSVLTTGEATYADAPNTDTGSGEVLNPVPNDPRSTTAYDVTVLKINFTAPALVNCLRFDFAFFSEEFPEFVADLYNDAFIAELDQTTWQAHATITAPDNFAFDANGHVISIKSLGVSMNAANGVGTTYDGGTALLQAATPLTPGEHTLYLSLLDQRDPWVDSAVFLDHVRFEQVANPATQCVPGAHQVGHQPLIFVPGMIASELRRGGEIMWVHPEVFNSAEDEFLRDLALHDNGRTPVDSRVVVGDIIRTAFVDGPGPLNEEIDFYESMMEHLRDRGYVEGVDLFVFPYDWRFDLRESRTKLIAKINQVLQTTGASKVDLLGHSTGGILMLDALEQPATTGKVRKAVTMGTPVLGAGKALSMLMYGEPCIPKFNLCVMKPSTVRTALQNSLGMYHLLPSRAYDDAVGPPVDLKIDVTGDGRPEGPQRFPAWSKGLRQGPTGWPEQGLLNGPLIDDADFYHTSVDTFTPADPSVEMVRIVGDGLDTAVGIDIRVECRFRDNVSRECHNRGAIRLGNGDGTAPFGSTSLYNYGRRFDRRGTIPNVYFHGMEHTELTHSQVVMDYVAATFDRTGTFQSATTAAPTQRADSNPWDAMLQPEKAAAVASLPSSQPQAFSATELQVWGALNGAVTSGGKVLGANPQLGPGVISQDIPGSSFYQVMDTQSFVTTQPGYLTANFIVTADGPIQMRVRTHAYDVLNGQAVFYVDAPVGAALRLNYQQSPSFPDLRVGIDLTNNGSIDQQLAPKYVVTGTAARDGLAPVSTLNATTTAGQTSVTLSASDWTDMMDYPSSVGGGCCEVMIPAGVDTIYYQIGGDSGTLQRYVGSFTVPAGTEIHYWAVDKAGNVEVPRAYNPTITFTQESYPVRENAGTAKVTLTLSKASAHPVSVNFATSSDAAMIGVDYVAKSGTVTFNPGETSKDIVITLLDDTTAEYLEAITIMLSQPVNGRFDDSTISSNATLIELQDNEMLVYFDAGSMWIEEDHGVAMVPVMLNAPAVSEYQISVAYATSDGTAVASSDYTARSGRITFHAGTMTEWIAVPILEDTLAEPGESLVVTLSAPTNMVLGAQRTFTVGLNDNDSALPCATISAPTPCVFGTRSVYTSPYAADGGQVEMITAYGKYWKFAYRTGALQLMASGDLAAHARYTQPGGPCAGRAPGTCQFTTRAVHPSPYPSDGGQVEMITAYGKYWKYAYRADTQALIGSGDLTTMPRYAQPGGPCEGRAAGTCQIDTRTVYTSPYASDGGQVEMITAYGKYWKYAYRADTQALIASGDLATNVRYMQPGGPCEGRPQGTCHFDTRTVYTSPYASDGGQVEMITAYGKYWKYAYRADTQALIGSGDLATNVRYK